MNGSHADDAAPVSRLAALRIALLCVLGGLALYLFVLQVIKGVEFEELAKQFAQRETVVPAQRGAIYDGSFTRPLVANRPAFSIDVTPALVPGDRDDLDALLASLAEALDIDPEYMAGQVPLNESHLFQPIEVLSGADFPTVAYLGEHIHRFEGVSWRNEPVRDYSDLGALAHVIGYVGEISVEELQVLYNEGYRRGDTIGKSGLEQRYDERLRGTPGLSYRTVDALQRDLGTREGRPPVPGNDLVLTIDARIQRLAEDALAGRIGSVVVLRPSTGEIVAMVSYPWFDPGLFRGADGAQELRRKLLDPTHPFVNRAVHSAHAPGSVFKLIMSVAVLEERLIPPEQTIHCSGIFRLGRGEWEDHVYPDSHGDVDLREALAESCNIYYYTVGHKLGVERIVHYARAFGLGSPTGIELPREQAGFLPTPAWKQRRHGEPWVGGDTINMSIGQGAITATPLQIANVVAAIANDGVVYQPYLVKEGAQWRRRLADPADSQHTTAGDGRTAGDVRVRARGDALHGDGRNSGDRDHHAGGAGGRQDGHRPDPLPGCRGAGAQALLVRGVRARRRAGGGAVRGGRHGGRRRLLGVVGAEGDQRAAARDLHRPRLRCGDTGPAAPYLRVQSPR